MEMLVIHLSLSKVTFLVIQISQVKSATQRVLRFLVTPLKLKLLRKVIALTRETTLNHQSKSSLKKKIKIVTFVMRLSQVSQLNKVHLVSRIQYSFRVQTTSKVCLRKLITKRCSLKEFYLHPLQPQVQVEFINLNFKKCSQLTDVIIKYLTFKNKLVRQV